MRLTLERYMAPQTKGVQSLEWIGRLLLLMMIVLSATHPRSSIAQTVNLEKVEYHALSSTAVQVIFKTNVAIAEPKSFVITDPARLTLDFIGVDNKSDLRHLKVGVGPLRSIDLAQTQGRTRAVLSLNTLPPYYIEVNPREIRVNVGISQPSASAHQTNPLDKNLSKSATVSQNSSAQTAPSPTVTFPLAKNIDNTANNIEKVDFHRGQQGEGRVIINLRRAPGVPPDLKYSEGKIIVDFPQTELPKQLEQQMDVIDFATPVKKITVSQWHKTPRVAITATGDYEHSAYQSGNQYIIDVRTKIVDETQENQKPVYKGELLTLNFQDIEVRSVLQVLADFTGLNIVVSDSVRGNITLRLKEVPWDQAMDIILKIQGLGMKKEGGVVYVAPAVELATKEKETLEATKQITELVPVRSEYVRINYAKASEVAAILQSQGSAGGGVNTAPSTNGDKKGIASSSFLSERGRVAVDERTNSLLLQDTPQKIEDIRKVIALLDIPVRQVLIESRLVVANDDFSKSLGARFGVSGVKQASDTVVMTSGKIEESTDKIVNSVLDNYKSTGQAYPVEMPTGLDRLNVNLPATGATNQIAFAILGSGYLLDLELSAMQSEGKGEIISTPRVVTSDQSEAVIEQGKEVPYKTVSAQGTSTSFKKATLSLKVIPHITPDDSIMMDLTVSQNSIGQLTDDGPAIDVQQVSTQVLVKNGETVVLGGIYQQSTQNKVQRVPFFSDLPVVGNFFKNNEKNSSKVELLIFVTPKILKDTSQKLGLN